jgi:hypothetical protein
MSTIPRLTVGLLLLTVAFGCRPDDQRTDSVDPMSGEAQRAEWGPEILAHVDAGNAAIRTDSFDVAREHFLAVTELDPDLVVGWFGLYMAEDGLGDEEAAAAALARVREISAGASLVHPGGDGPQGQ